jgi:hypothetical protein
MARLYRGSLSTYRLIRRRFRLFVFFAPLALVVVGVTHAAPVKFQFEATIDTITGTPNTSVQVQPGDMITGTFSYEPTPFGSRGGQIADLSFHFANLTLRSREYEIRLENDQLAFPGNFRFDAASLGCSFSMTAVQCDPADIPQLNGWNWEAFINFSGDANVLRSTELISNILERIRQPRTATDIDGHPISEWISA